MSDPPRPIWLGSLGADTLRYYAARADSGADQAFLYGLADAHDAAPADATEAVAKAVHDSSRESDEECSWDDETNEWIKQAFRDYEALAVLRALGMPEPNDAQGR